TVLEPEEILLLDWDQVMLRVADQEVFEDIFIPERITLAERIRESIFIYLQDLNCGNPKELILPLKILGEDWEEKLTHCCQEIIDLNLRLKTNGQFLEAYYQLG
ncbi:7304_t:CDS:1, partial [Racocetra persica]